MFGSVRPKVVKANPLSVTVSLRHFRSRDQDAETLSIRVSDPSRISKRRSTGRIICRS
jgi:hypothetical protein